MWINCFKLFIAIWNFLRFSRHSFNACSRQHKPALSVALIVFGFSQLSFYLYPLSLFREEDIHDKLWAVLNIIECQFINFTTMIIDDKIFLLLTLVIIAVIVDNSIWLEFDNWLIKALSHGWSMFSSWTEKKDEKLSNAIWECSTPLSHRLDSRLFEKLLNLTYMQKSVELWQNHLLFSFLE